LYESCHRHQDQPIILDDLDHLYRDGKCVRLMKALCNTERTKTMRWVSKHPMVGDQPGQIPSIFMTTSPICLLANEWKTTNENVRAVEDRAIVLEFKPSPAELHREVGGWYQNRTVYDFLGKHLSLIPRHSMRHYVRGDQLYDANPGEWPALLLEAMGVDDRIRKIVTLAADDEFRTEEERAEEFEAAGLGSRATYFRWKKNLRDSGKPSAASSAPTEAKWDSPTTSIGLVHLAGGDHPTFHETPAMEIVQAQSA